MLSTNTRINCTLAGTAGGNKFASRNPGIAIGDSQSPECQTAHLGSGLFGQAEIVLV